jgi:phage portal protein BeeE
MKFLTKYFNKSNEVKTVADIEAPEQKSLSVPLALAQLFASNGWHDLWAVQALLYYRQCSPLATAVDRITDEIAKIKPCLYDVKKNKFIDDHPVYELLERPFADNSFSDFIKEMAVFLIVTGNNYSILRGNVKREPLELVNVHPTTVTVMASPWDGYNELINVNSLPYVDSFTRDTKMIKRMWRYVNNMGYAEAWQSRTFNSVYQGGGGKYGMSVLTPIYYEIEQHINSAIHNLALLTNGGKLSMAYETEQSLTNDQYDRMHQALNQAYAGARNAGKIQLLDKGVKAKEMSISNKDMDFFNLKNSNVIQIYNTLKIPLPLVMPEHMTMDNVSKAMLALYFYAVLPWLEYCYEQLSMFILPRYDNTENLKISYQLDKIPALAEYRMQIAKAKKDLGAYTPNEIRAMLGDKLLNDDGMDEVHMQSNFVPIVGMASQEEQRQQKEFMNIMLNQKDGDGNQLFTQKDIKEMARDYGFK